MCFLHTLSHPAGRQAPELKVFLFVCRVKTRDPFGQLSLADAVVIILTGADFQRVREDA